MIFPIRPPYILGETACGYTLRLVEANGYDWRRSTFASRGIRMKDLTHGTTSALARILDPAIVERIDWFTPRASETGGVILCGEAFQPSQILYDRQRFCVGCWADDSGRSYGSSRRPLHLRGWWSVAALISCPLHAIRLLDRCAECSRTNRIGQASCTSCMCGADLARVARIEVPSSTLAAERYVVGRLGGLPRIFDPVLDGLPLGDAVNLMQRLGCCLTAGRDVRFGRLPTERRSEMMLAGYHAIQRGPEGVEEALELLLAAPGRLDQLRVQIGQLYCWFSRLPKGRLQSWMAERIANVVRRHRISWQGWDRHVGSSPVPDRISASQAKLLFGSGWERTVAVLEAAGLRCELQDRCRPTVDRRQVQMLAKRLETLVDVNALAKRVGITPASVRKLVEAEILPLDPLGQTASAFPRFDPAAVEAILGKMAGRAPFVASPPKGSACLAAAARSVGIVPLCRALLEGRLAPIGQLEAGPGFKRIFVPTTGIVEACRVRELPQVTLSEAGRILRMRQYGLALIAGTGLIPVGENSRGRRVLDRRDVEQFGSRFVSTTELARSRSTSARAILSRLTAAGCRPAIELAVRGQIEIRLFDRSCEIYLKTPQMKARERSAPSDIQGRYPV
ncbi:TniQ family protein [Methylobacterium haplocladii]|uniref:TniQ family protein n=1 Tax=Methylobacterium haplocladii TaxID=1176176 RepID=UPI0014792008|nr:TniQ family protein [Methylobacterium haplocladii]